MARSYRSKSVSMRIGRREFVKRVSLAVGAGVLAGPAILSAQSPANKLNIAIIGAGGRGGGNTKEVSGENIVALCDVYEPALEKAAQKYPKAKKVKPLLVGYISAYACR